ncbi:MAG: NUMOD4 motif-containing HNH endonuclease [Chloroflexi bacterium]|nr:NUMOD4 motif-containing HNH endonuclease [Chloroflexota bacterium]MBU1747828.1 NUMOD4 motif-containing HNH endonuclease [Chloroflexota bacterium]
MSAQPESWRPIPEFPGYEVSDRGRVRSYLVQGRREWHIANTPQRVLSSGSHGTKCYPMVMLRKDGKTHGHRIHRLVMLAFVGPCPEGMEICHNDGNRRNNHLKNMRYDTHQNNVIDCIVHGTSVAKLADQQVAAMREARRSGALLHHLSELYGVSLSSVSRIVRGITRASAPGPIQE